jgi:hypothetical protein
LNVYSIVLAWSSSSGQVRARSPLQSCNGNSDSLIPTASDEQISERLTTWVLDNFPIHPNGFFCSIAYKLLFQLSASLLSVTYRANTPPNLQKFHQDVSVIFPALHALSSFQPDSHVLPDSAIFQKLKVAAPTSSAEAKKIGSELLSKLKKILQVCTPPRNFAPYLLIGNVQYYLGILRRSDLTAIFRSIYISEETNTCQAASTEKSFNLVQPMNSVLYFESAQGFGEWRILISTRAEKHLRQARKKDGKMFIVIMKKIRLAYCNIAPVT